LAAREAAVLLEAAARFSPAYEGIRTTSIGSAPKRKYVKYSRGARELYDLDFDPRERTDHYTSTSPVAASLATRLRALRACAGDTCFTAENGP